MLFQDLARQLAAFRFERNVARRIGAAEIDVPIVASRRTGGPETWIALASPIAPGVPADPGLRDALAARRALIVDDLLVRRNLPAAVRNVREALN